MKLNSTWHWSIICGLLLIALSQTAAQAQGQPLPQPESMTVDRSLSRAEAAQLIKTARLFYAFWDTGNAEYASAAVDNDFRDNTLPAGRPQGPKGLLYASQAFRSAVPDLHCTIEDLLVNGEKITARLLFTGTHKGEFMGHPATGKPVRFFAIDILRCRDRIDCRRFRPSSARRIIETSRAKCLSTRWRSAKKRAATNAVM